MGFRMFIINGARAVSRKTPIYFIVCLFQLLIVHALKTSYFCSLTFKKTSAEYFDFEQLGIWSESF